MIIELKYILTTIIVLSNICIAFLVYKSNSKNKVNTSFALLTGFSVIWILSNFFENEIKNIFFASILLKIDFLSACLVIYNFFRFCYVFKTPTFSKSGVILLKIFLIFCIFFNVLSFTNLIVKNITILESGISFKTGSFFFLYAIYLFLSVTLGIYFLIKKYINEIGVKKLQALYILIGFSISFLIALFTNLIFAALNIISTDLSRVGIYGIIFFVVSTAYSILKYRLMDIRLIISKGILFFILVLVVALTFTFITFTTGQLLQGRGEIIITLIVSLIIVIGIDPLKRLLAKWTDFFFFKGKIDYQIVLRDISNIIARELDLERLLQLIEENLAKEIKVKFVNVFLYRKNHEQFSFSTADFSKELNQDDLVLKYLQGRRAMVITEELSREKSDKKTENEKEELDKLQERLDKDSVGLAAPIMAEGKITGIFLIGQKLSGSPFSQEEINFFDILTPQVATALEKSKLFEEVQAAKQNLEQLVEQRTQDLKERNLYLTALQKLISVITRSLDFQKVMQTIADGISSELGYIGGILSFIDFEKRVIRIGAISNTTLVQKMIHQLPQDPTLYEVSLDNMENTSIKAIKSSQIVVSSEFYDSVRPALPQLVAKTIQKLAGIKAIMSVPVYTEEKVIGVIDFILKKAPEEITDVEKEMMKSLADQVGIVYRNLILYQKIQKANVELKDANVRLQQLDQAKSEFLSIASHQLRTPLTGIKGYLSMILEGDFGSVPVKLKSILEDLFQNTDRLTRLVNVFLNVSRIESGRFELEKKEVDIVKMIEEVINEFKLNADKKNLKFDFIKPSKLVPFISIDRDKVKDVLVNLVDNSIKYTPKGKVEVILERDADQVKISVKDTGVGVKKEEVNNLFKKFVRGEGIAQIHTGGSGLGLYIAKNIIEAHQGKIWVESEGLNRGAAFIFTLPYHESNINKH